MEPQVIYVGDTETTGLSDKDKLVEIGWFECDPELNIVNEFESLIDPEMPISPSASAAHNLVSKDLIDSPTYEELFDIVLCGVEFKPATLVCHNIPFDIRFWPKEMNIVDTLCTLKAARLVYPDAPDHKLQTLVYMLGIKDRNNTAHRALSDVSDLYNFLQAMLEETGKTFSEFKAWVNKPRRVERMPFGKHRGKKLEQLPADYVGWVLGNCDNLDGDLRKSLEDL